MTESIQQLEEQVIMLRARLTSIIERERIATINAQAYAKALEDMLRLANGPVYNDLCTRSGNKVADFFVTHRSALLDLFSVPLGLKIGSVQDDQQDANLKDTVAQLEKELHEARQRANQLAEENKTLKQTIAAHQKGDSAGARQSTLPAAPPAQLGQTPVASTPVVSTPVASTPAVVEQPANPPLPITVVSELSGRHIDIIRFFGETGEFLMPPLFETLSGRDWASSMTSKSLEATTSLLIRDAVTVGLLKNDPIDLQIPSSFVPVIGNRVVSFTPQGRSFYSDRFGNDPIDRLTPYVAKYKTVEAGLMIRLTRRILEKSNEKPDRRWTVIAIIDAVWEDETAFARIPGAQKSYHAPDSKSYSLPDLIFQMEPISGGSPITAVVEVERGQYKLPDLRAKWERAMHCYPPVPLYVVAPNKKTCNSLYQEWRKVSSLLEGREELGRVSYTLMYTLDELESIGLYSPKQMRSVLNRRDALKKALESGDAQSANDPLLKLFLPRYWEPKLKYLKKG